MTTAGDNPKTGDARDVAIATPPAPRAAPVARRLSISIATSDPACDFMRDARDDATATPSRRARQCFVNAKMARVIIVRVDSVRRGRRRANTSS